MTSNCSPPLPSRIAASRSCGRVAAPTAERLRFGVLTMGYDFMFISLPEKGSFPLRIEDAPPSLGALPWPPFRDWLLAMGGRVNGADNCIWVDYSNEGSICFTGDEQCISLDTHAEWAQVLRAFQKLKSLDPDACLFD